MNASIATRQSSPKSGTATGWVLHSHHFHAALLRALYEAPEVDAAALLARALAAAGPALAPPSLDGVSAGATLVECFHTWGLGLLDPVGMQSDGTGMVVVEGSHSARAWAARYTRAKHPVCGIASGILARLLEDLFGRSLDVREVECAAMGAERCRFEISRADTRVREAERGMGMTQVSRGLEGLFVPSQAVPLEVGAGAPFVALPAGFYASISHRFEVEVPRLRGSKFASLPGIMLTEAAHRNGFHLFGEALTLTDHRQIARGATEHERLEFLFGVVDRLGWGEWRIQSFLPGERLIVRISGSYEAMAHLHQFGRDSRTRCTVALGAAAAMMTLLYRAPEGPLPALTPSFYTTLFRNPHTFRASETRCVACGDEYCELVVNPLTA